MPRLNLLSRTIVLRQRPDNSPRRGSIMGLGRMRPCPAGILRRPTPLTGLLRFPGKMERSMSPLWLRKNCHWASEGWLLRTITSTTNTVNNLSQRNRTAFPITPFPPSRDRPPWFRAVHRMVATLKRIILPTIPTAHHANLSWIMDMDTVHPPTLHYILPLLAA